MLGGMKVTIVKKVFVAEDSAAVRARLVEMLNDLPGVSVVGEAATPADTVAGILRTFPDYVLLDFQLEGGTGVDVLRTIRSQVPGVVFVVLTNFAQPQVRAVCMKAGADAFFDKSTEMGKVKDLIAGTSTA